MLGTVGFSAAALTFIAYGLTVSSFKVPAKVFNLGAYENAYYIAAIAFLTWGIATVTNTASLSRLVLLGDALIFIAVIMLIRVVAPAKQRNLYSVILAVLAIIALVYRYNATGPSPTMLNSVLVFNTPRLFAAFIGIVLIVLWFPANMKFYDLVVAKTKSFQLLRTNYYVTNLVAIIGVSGFLFARKKFTIVLSFSILVFAMVVLTIFNYMAKSSRKKEPSHAK